MKKKLLLFLIIFAVLIGGGYALTQALFSDTETSSANTFTAGTLDMTVNGSNGTQFDNIAVDNIGADGTVSGDKEWTIHNAGTVPGNLTFRVNDVVNTENGCNEPEATVDTTCDNPGAGEGELGAATAATVQLDSGAGYNQVVNTTLATANQGQFATQWGTNAHTVTIPAGGSVKVKMHWANDPATYGNEIQSDGLSFGVQFDLTQVNPS